MAASALVMNNSYTWRGKIEVRKLLMAMWVSYNNKRIYY